MRNLIRFALTGLLIGFATGFLFSLVSGNVRVIVGIAAIGLILGVVLGIVHWND